MGTILLVEDEEPLRDCLSQYLAGNGHLVLQARSDTANMFLESDQAVDVLITDVVMPGVSGAALARAFADKHPDLPIVFMSGYGQEIMERYPGAPPAIFLQKPFLPTQLRQVIGMLLALRSMRVVPRAEIARPKLLVLPAISSGPCGVSAEVTDRYLLEQLDESSRRDFEPHLVTCVLCAERARVYAHFVEQLKALLEPRRK